MITYEHRMTAYFWRRKNREDATTGKAPISLRIIIDGFPRAEFRTPVEATAAQWCLATQRLQTVRGMSKEDQQLLQRDNATLSRLTLTLDQAYNNFRSQGGNPSPATLRELLRGKRVPAFEQTTLLAAMRQLEEYLRGKNRRPSTIENCEKATGILVRYLLHLRRQSLTVQEVDRPWLRKFEKWCLAVPLGGRTIRNYISALVRALDLMVDEGLLKENLLAGYTYISEKEVPEKRHLEAEELQRLAGWPFTAPPEARVRDLFVFCCYTGLSYADYSRFVVAPQQYLVQAGGVQGIQMTRQKMLYMESEFWVPVFQQAADLLVRYQMQLPHYEKSTINKRLKQLAAVCELSLPDLSHKDARSTFSQLMRDRYGRRLAARMAGHSEKMADEHYSTDKPAQLAAELRVLGAPLTDN